MRFTKRYLISLLTCSRLWGSWISTRRGLREVEALVSCLVGSNRSPSKRLPKKSARIYSLDVVSRASLLSSRPQDLLERQCIKVMLVEVLLTPQAALLPKAMSHIRKGRWRCCLGRRGKACHQIYLKDRASYISRQGKILQVV